MAVFSLASSNQSTRHTDAARAAALSTRRLGNLPVNVIATEAGKEAASDCGRADGTTDRHRGPEQPPRVHDGSPVPRAASRRLAAVSPLAASIHEYWRCSVAVARMVRQPASERPLRTREVADSLRRASQHVQRVDRIRADRYAVRAD